MGLEWDSSVQQTAFSFSSTINLVSPSQHSAPPTVDVLSLAKNEWGGPGIKNLHDGKIKAKILIECNSIKVAVLKNDFAGLSELELPCTSRRRTYSA